MNDGFQEPRVAVSISRKINLGHYESVDIFMAASGIEPGSTDAEIEELLVTGDQAFQLLKRHLGDKVREIRERAKQQE